MTKGFRTAAELRDGQSSTPWPQVPLQSALASNDLREIERVETRNLEGRNANRIAVILEALFKGDLRTPVVRAVDVYISLLDHTAEIWARKLCAKEGETSLLELRDNENCVVPQGLRQLVYQARRNKLSSSSTATPASSGGGPALLSTAASSSLGGAQASFFRLQGESSEGALPLFSAIPPLQQRSQLRLLSPAPFSPSFEPALRQQVNSKRDLKPRADRTGQFNPSSLSLSTSWGEPHPLRLGLRELQSLRDKHRTSERTTAQGGRANSRDGGEARGEGVSISKRGEAGDRQGENRLGDGNEGGGTKPGKSGSLERF
jgi:hypothetical protein